MRVSGFSAFKVILFIYIWSFLDVYIDIHGDICLLLFLFSEKIIKCVMLNNVRLEEHLDSCE